jgi:hypothetical protein
VLLCCITNSLPFYSNEKDLLGLLVDIEQYTAAHPKEYSSTLLQ